MDKSSQKIEKPVELKFAVWGVGPETQMSDTWMDEVEKRTHGKLHFTRHYFKSVRGPDDADVFNDVPAMGGKYPLLDLLQTPYIIPGSRIGSRAVAQLLAEFEEFRNELSEVKTLGLGTGALMAIISSKAWGPIRTLEDLKGARTRSLPLIDKDLEALGAKPLHPKSFEEIGQMLDAGGLDAAVIGIGLVKGRQLARQAPYCNVGEGASISMHPMRTFMKRDIWNRLPLDIQKTLDGLGPVGGDCWYASCNGEIFDQAESEARQHIIENEGEIITIPGKEIARWIEALQPLREDRLKALEALGLPGRKFFNRMLELAQEYAK